MMRALGGAMRPAFRLGVAVAVAATFAWLPGHVQAQSITMPNAPSGSPRAIDVLEGLRVAWGLPEAVGPEEPSYATTRPEPTGLPWVAGTASEELLAEVQRSVKLLDATPLSDGQRRGVKKAAALAERGIRAVVEGLVPGTYTPEEAELAVMDSLSGYVQTLETLLRQRPPQS